MKRVVSVLVLFSVSVMCIFADTFNFDLRSFSPPDFSRTSLEIGAGLNSRYDYAQLLFDDSIEDKYERNLGYNPSISANLSYYSYSKAQIKSFSFNSHNFYTARLERSSELPSHNSNFYNTENSSSYTLKQYVSPTVFIDLLASAAADISISNSTYPRDDLYSQYSGTMGIGFGIGRIEDVSDARTALFMYEDFKRYGSLTADPTQQDIHDLASLIVQRRNVRAFDNRDKFVETVKALDVFFKSKDNISYDASFYAAISDVYLNAPTWTRLYGSTINLGIECMILKNVNTYDNPEYVSRVEMTHIIRGRLSYLYENPISQRWQISSVIENNLLYGVTDNTFDPNTDETTLSIHYSTFARIQAGYFPTQRTHAWIALNSEYAFHEQDIDNIRSPMKSWSLGVGSGVTYYISSQLSYSASLNYDHLFSKVPHQDPILTTDNLKINLSASYKIF